MTVDIVQISKDELAEMLRTIVKAEVDAKLDPLLSVIVVQQKDACEAIGVSDDTVRNKSLRGEINVLQRDGSRLNYITLKEIGGLKSRSNRKAK